MDYSLKTMLLGPKSKLFEMRNFKYNNACILALSAFLTLEQLYYGLFVNRDLSAGRSIHFITSAIMLVYFGASVYFKRKPPLKVTSDLNLYAISFGLVGFVIAVSRSVLEPSSVFCLPTIYIAVLYGFAFIFYFPPVATLLIYGASCALLIMAMPVYRPHLESSNYIYDIISNNIIAWVASVITYRRHVTEFFSNVLVEQQNQELILLSTTDTLTGLYNRRKLDELLESELRLFKHNRSSGFSVIIMDVDHFKHVNDELGHNIGDNVLAEMSDLLLRSLRDNDFIGRWGGEEFLFICPQTDSGQALMFAERLRRLVESHSFSCSWNITCSFGVSECGPSDTIYTLISRADRALYKAKSGGRNKSCLESL